VEVEIGELECRSVFEDRASRLTTFRLPVIGQVVPVELTIAERDDVVYLPNVLDRGQSLCVVGQSYVPQEAIYDPWTLDFVKSRRKAVPHFAARFRGPFDAAVCDERVCILGNVFSRNFAHWTEELLKVVIVEHLGISCKYVFADLPAFADEFLELMDLSPDRVLKPDGATRYASAIFTPAISHENIHHFGFSAELLRQALLSRLPPPGSSGRRRLWLERGRMVTNGGSTLNRDDVQRTLGKYDFEALDPATLPVRDQLLRMRDAEIIAGPHGAQFAHIMFMKRRSHVIECFSPTHVNPSVMQICRALGHSYNQIVSRSHLLEPYAHGRDLMVDCEHFELVMDYILSADRCAWASSSGRG
jgi:capsular polysaccharide biosynthesis protein